MNPRLALTAALTLGLTFPPAIAGACGQSAKATSAPERIAQAGTTTGSSRGDATVGTDLPKDSAAAQGSNGAAQPKTKHPPTAQMDRATPTEQSNAPASAKHPPTSQMDKAMPEEKSPGSKGQSEEKDAAPASAAHG